MVKHVHPSQPIYKFDEYGMLAFRIDGSQDNSAYYNPSDSIAFFIDDGMIHKHGRADRVSEYVNKIRTTMASADPSLVETMEVVELPVDKLTNEMLNEINACLATSGRASTLKEKLTAMFEENPAIEP